MSLHWNPRAILGVGASERVGDRRSAKARMGLFAVGQRPSLSPPELHEDRLERVVSLPLRKDRERPFGDLRLVRAEWEGEGGVA